MSKQKRLLHIFMGPIILMVTTLLLSDALSVPGAQATGTLLWMIYWWLTRPVHITVAGLLPVIVNALLGMVEMSTITAQYASSSIILIFGSGLICMPWASIGLDRRLALKTLSIIGPSLKSQITVWLFASILLSTVLPNTAVSALLIPIAVSMLKVAGYEDVKSAAPAVPILLAIVWGAAIGGIGTPLGGAMNLAAIDFIQTYTGEEFMYIDWITRILPYFIISAIGTWIFMLLMPNEVKRLNGTKEYFIESYKELGKMKKEEITCAILFIVAALGAFSRPFYEDILPALEPAYLFLIIGSLSFFLTIKDKKALLTWEYAEKNTMWGMMVMFGGGLALGKLINESGASARIAEIISSMSLDGGLTTIIIIVVFTRIVSELTNSTTGAAVTIPIVLSFASELGLNPIPFWFIAIMAYNAEFVLPISFRAIPVAYGLDANKMLKYGLPMTIINMVIVVVVGYALMQIWPYFSEIPYLFQ